MWDNLWIYGGTDGGWDTLTSILHIILVILVLFLIFAAIAAACYGEKGRGGRREAGGGLDDLGGWATEGLRSAAHSAEELVHTASRSISETFEGLRSRAGGAEKTAGNKAGETVSV